MRLHTKKKNKINNYRRGLKRVNYIMHNVEGKYNGKCVRSRADRRCSAGPGWATPATSRDYQPRDVAAMPTFIFAAPQKPAPSRGRTFNKKVANKVSTCALPFRLSESCGRVDRTSRRTWGEAPEEKGGTYSRALRQWRFPSTDLRKSFGGWKEQRRSNLNTAGEKS
jgi:hypothetical protein